MADNRIHPGGQEETPLPPPPSKSSLPPGTYVVQFPKDQIIRQAPPPRRPPHQGRHRRRNRCCYCFCGILLTLILLAAILVGVFFLVYRPKAPKYSIHKLSIQGFNLTSSPSTVYTPTTLITLRADNPNNKIGIYYGKASSISVTHSEVELCKGVLPMFYQPARNVSALETTLRGSGLRFSTADYNSLREQQRNREIPLRLDVKVPVRFKVSSIRTWRITVRVRCDITVDSLTRDASVMSSKCDVKNIRPWG